MRVWLALSLAGCASAGAARPPTVTYALSSPDVGVAWHLHARDGAFVCALPCERALPADSGAWLGVHDPKKSWRVNVPSELPAAPGSRVFATVQVGRGTPALGTIGSIAAIGGGTSAVAGLALLIASLSALAQGCDASAPTCGNFESATTFGSIGATMLVVGTVLGVLGAYWMEHDRAPTLRLAF